MAIDRRRFLTGSAGLVAGLALPARALGAAGPSSSLYAAACKDAAGRFAAVLFDADRGDEVAKVVLPERGHDFAVRPGGGTDGPEIVAFARRPGSFAVVFGRAGRPPLWFTTRDDRYFYGHGVFSADGRLLYTTENDFEAGEGRIGVRDATNGYVQIGEFPSGGIGPHDLALLGDKRTIVVANGGIKTHPETPRLELNLPTMEPSLAYVDSAAGDVLERHDLPPALHQLSLRHLTVGKADTVMFGCQFRGPSWESQPIVGRHRRGQPLELLALPADVLLGMRNYVASLAVDPSGETALVAAPRGGIAVAIDVASGRFLARHAMPNVFGVAPRTGDGGYVLISGNGELGVLASISGAIAIRPRAAVAAWDNHVTLVG